jgi:fructose-1,6-bisphosphatase/inositol monophosphatase family enzyme
MASEADVNTEALIRREVAEQFADDAFLGEESSNSFVPSPGDTSCTPGERVTFAGICGGIR